MKIIRLIISSACFVVASLAVIPAHAGSSDFAGPYIAVQGSVNAGLLSGTYTDKDKSNTDGTGGHGFPIAGGAIGFNIPLGHVFFIGIEGSFDPGSANIARSNDAFETGDVRVTVSDRETWSITPGISLSEGSAIYFKFGDTDMNFRCTVGKTCPSSLSGDTYGIGTIAKFGESGLYVKTEAGVTDFNDIAITSLGKGGNGKIAADPNMVYGKIQIGYQF
jgi:hypothetical protein